VSTPEIQWIAGHEGLKRDRQGRILQRRGVSLVVVVPRDVLATFVPRPTLFFAGGCLRVVLAVVLAVLVSLLKRTSWQLVLSWRLSGWRRPSEMQPPSSSPASCLRES
jgi:hypothetical protein